MRFIDSWTAFLLTLFALVGLCGLFASYAPSIPAERGLARVAILDEALAAASTPDAAQRLDLLRPRLGDLAKVVLDGTGPVPDRIAAAKTIVADEQRREAASVGYRTRLMLGVVTVLAAGLGAGILTLARRQAAREQA